MWGLIWFISGVIVGFLVRLFTEDDKEDDVQERHILVENAELIRPMRLDEYRVPQYYGNPIPRDSVVAEFGIHDIKTSDIIAQDRINDLEARVFELEASITGLKNTAKQADELLAKELSATNINLARETHRAIEAEQEIRESRNNNESRH